MLPRGHFDKTTIRRSVQGSQPFFSYVQRRKFAPKRGRGGVIMIAPAAQTSKGLAKAFVISAGGKGPELLSLQTKNFRPLFLEPRAARLHSNEQRGGG